ncbi:MAG TPA: PHB depolymerase family esterase [Candidatus Binataceae bacterium]|nr:PHB depolymerase family esterase [Candidatus Binataceae bacterium]
MLILVLLSIASALAFAADSTCGPFGDAPAQIQTGLWPSLVVNHGLRCFGGEKLGPWLDSDGTQRYACLYDYVSSQSNDAYPLVVFVHGSLANADSTIATGLIPKSKSTNLGTSHPGFVLLAPEGRETTHYYTAPDDRGMGWDNWYRQFSRGDVIANGTTYKENVDAAAIDHFIQQVEASRKIDRNRIYMTGWSNGAAMALLYALNRRNIAAAAVYSAPDPFSAFDDACPQTPVAGAPASTKEISLTNPKVPIMHVRNSCDIGGICPNGLKFVSQIKALGNQIDDIIVNPEGIRVQQCDPLCGTNPDGGGDISTSGSMLGFKHHLAWPRTWNDRMFDFMKNHPLPAGQ